MTSLARKLRRSNALTRHRECTYPNYILASTGAYDFNFPRRTKINRLPLSTEAFVTAWFFPPLTASFEAADYPEKIGESDRTATGLATVTKDLIEEFSARSASRIRAVCLSMNM